VWPCYIEIALVLYWPVFVQYNLLSAHKTISSKARIPILHGRGTTARDNCTSSKRMRVRACIGRPAFGSMETQRVLSPPYKSHTPRWGRGAGAPVRRKGASATVESPTKRGARALVVGGPPTRRRGAGAPTLENHQRGGKEKKH
jgi:hypothetical protein